MKRRFELKLVYSSHTIGEGYECQAVDMLLADSLESLVAQLAILISQLENRLMTEDKIEKKCETSTIEGE